MEDKEEEGAPAPARRSIARSAPSFNVMPALAPQADLVNLYGVGHLSTMEAPDAVTAHLNRFLAGLGA